MTNRNQRQEAEATSSADAYRDMLVIDGVSPLLEKKQHVDLYRTGGVTLVGATVAARDNTLVALESVASWLSFLTRREDLLLVKSVADIAQAKRDARLGVMFHFQGTAPFEQNLDLVDAFYAMGVRMVMLAYNKRGLVGDGCEEPSDAGLSRFGRRMVERLNNLGIVVDLSHTGLRTSLDAIEMARRPVVFSHSNAAALHASPRNIRDEQAKAAAATGGLVGLTLVPYLTVKDRRPTLDDFIDHICHFADLIGIDHVGLGLDYYWGQQPFAGDDLAEQIWQAAVDAGDWDPQTYPKPPHYYPVGLETPAKMQNLVLALDRRGFSADEIAGVMGRNWLRVFTANWG